MNEDNPAFVHPLDALRDIPEPNLEEWIAWMNTHVHAGPDPDLWAEAYKFGRAALKEGWPTLFESRNPYENFVHPLSTFKDPYVLQRIRLAMLGVE